MSKVILVTGAASGIGRAVANRLKYDGHRVYGADLAFKDPKVADSVDFHALHMDVTSMELVEANVQHILTQEGRIDGLFANAGICGIGVTELIQMEDAHRIFDVNFFGVLRCIKAVLPSMRDAAPNGKGTLMVTSSNLGKLSLPGLSTYCASKHAIEALVNSLEDEMKQYFPGINVVTIEPGFIRTDIYKSSLGIWINSMKHPQAHAYRDGMNKLFYEFKSIFNDAMPVEEVGKAVSKAFATDRPKARYKCGEQIHAKAI